MAATRSAGSRRRRLPDGRQNRVVVRLSDEEYLAVAARAAAARLTLPSYLATCGLKPDGVPVADLRYALIGLDGSRRLLAGATNNLNQLAARLNASGAIGESLPSVLDVVQRGVARVEEAAAAVAAVVGGRTR